MSAPKRPSDDQDPDYVSPGPTNAKQQKIYEETARANTANKITSIIEKEFTKEIDEKEKEVLEIQNRLHKALKTLHLLRYVVVTDFYNRKQCQAPQAATDTKQTQIHPAIKRLVVGKTPRRQRVGLQDPQLPSTSSNFQTSFQQNDKDEARVKTETSEIEKRLGQEISGLKIEEKSSLERKNDDDPPKKIPRYIPPKSNLPDISSPSRGMRHKVRKRIVVGNISKWIPPDWREDGASHKWMMYVRGSKEAPDITDFVSKVRFFLHPSYQPNDVVQVVSPPFHLSRRGWGEFPLRVQLHFKNPLNKPMDIIHYLKLDRTYTGLQTLGSETVVDIWIHATTTQKILKNNQDLDFESKDAVEKFESNDIDTSIVKKEFQDSETLVNASKISEIIVKIEPNDESVCADENDTQMVNDNCIKIEHNYVSKTSGDSEITEVVNSKENNVTIKHFSPLSDKGCAKKISPTLNDCLSFDPELNKQEDLRNNVESSSSSLTEMNNINSGDKNENSEQIDENVVSPLRTNRGKQEFKMRIDEFSATAKASKEKLVQSILSDNDINRRSEKLKNLRKNVENGEPSPLPIKLVKCNDKFFLMTDIGKLTSNKVDFVKIANSNIVKNILAKKIQPSKISAAGQTDVGSKRSTVMKSATPVRAETSELSNGQNGIEKSESVIMERNASDYLVSESKLRIDSMDLLMTSKNFPEFERRKSETAENLSKNNIQRLEMQKLASSLRSIPSKSEPLKITIPPAFEPTRKKQILVLKNNKLISVSAADRSSLTATLNSRQLAPRSNSGAETKVAESLLINRNKVSVLTTGAKPTEGMSLLKPSVSILKKPVNANNTLKLDSSSQNKPATVLKINSSNSLLLNSNSAIPALQIALPYNNGQNERRNLVAQNRFGQVKLKRLPKGVKIDNFDEGKPAKVSVTIGKDKQKILSKKETYEDILRSIEAVQINNVIGALRYIVKRIPLVTQEARDSDYKQMHPYACCTQDEFFNYHLGKQRAHEWYRAKTVRSLLRKKGFEDQQLWSTKEILKWARVHGYTPVQPSLAIDNAVKTSKISSDVNSKEIKSTCTESLQFNEWLDSCKDSNNFDEESDIEVDVIHISTERKIKSEFKTETTDLPKDMITLELDSSLQLPTAFVNETAREVGVRLQKEEIIPGVMHRAAERVIVKAMQCLVDDITRRSFAKAWERNSSKCPDTIVLDDVRDALLSREEFDVFTNEGLGSLQNIG